MLIEQFMAIRGEAHMRRNLVKVVGLSTLVVFSAAVGALASGGFNAQQSGVHQNGGGQAGRLTIRVEQALADPANDLLPDPAVCPTTGTPAVTISSTGCPRGALDFTIENTSNVPLRVTGVAPLCTTAPGQQTCTAAGFNSDKNANDGSFAADELSGTCAGSASFTAPNIIDAGGIPSNPGGNLVNS